MNNKELETACEYLEELNKYIASLDDKTIVKSKEEWKEFILGVSDE